MCYIVIIGASQSKPLINHSYEKIAVLMNVCMRVCVWYIVHVLIMHAIDTVMIVSLDRMLTLI